MRAAVLTDYDSPPRIADFDDPGAEGGQAVVEVSAAGLNPVDLFIATGGFPGREPPLPSVAGLEGIGTIDGRRVYFGESIAPYGSMAERTVIDTQEAIDVPDGVDDALAVSFGIAGMAAWLGLEWRGGLEEGETVLVLGATGVVGQVAVQAAQLLGAGRVVAAGRNQVGLDRARDELGADAVVNLADAADDLPAAFREAAGGDIDLVLDPIWGDAAVAALQSLGQDGRLVQIGNSSAPEATIPARAVRGRQVSILGHTNFAAPLDVRSVAFQVMCDHGAAGDLTVPLETIALEDVGEAWKRQTDGPGQKLVLTIS